MNKHELKTVRQEAQRYSKDADVVLLEDGFVRITLPYINRESKPIAFFVAKRKGSKKFSLMIAVESVGITAVNDTLVTLQSMLRTYGLLVSQEAVILEESSLPLHKRIRNMTQALIGIDGVRRLWKVEHDRRQHVESEGPESLSISPNDRPSR